MSQKSYVPHICSQVCIELISYEITVFRPKDAYHQDLTSNKQTQFSGLSTYQFEIVFALDCCYIIKPSK